MKPAADVNPWSKSDSADLVPQARTLPAVKTIPELSVATGVPSDEGASSRDDGGLTLIGRPFLAAFSAKDGWQSTQQSFQIEPQSPILDIFQIELHAHLKGWVLARGNLPEAGHPGLYF